MPSAPVSCSFEWASDQPEPACPPTWKEVRKGLVHTALQTLAFGTLGLACSVGIYLPSGLISRNLAHCLFFPGFFILGMMGLAALLAIPAIPLLLALAVGPWPRPAIRARCFISALHMPVYPLLFLPTLHLTDAIHRHAWEATTRRGQQIISAIERHRSDHHRPPSNLKELVGRYIPAIPGTGLAGFPEFDYQLPNQGAEFKTYELSVNAMRGMGFDRFVYWPEKEYPDQLYGGATERIRDWAYVHE